MAKDYNLEKRKYVIASIAILVVLVFISRLFILQLLTDDYKKNADSNAFLNKIKYPSRGIFYDRNNKLLVYNQPAYDVMVVMKEVVNLDTLDFCRTLNITKEYFIKRMIDIKDRSKNPGYSRFTHQLFMVQLSAEETGVLQEKLFKFHGFYVQQRSIRQYSNNSAGHILGDIGEVSMANIEEDDYYMRGDYIGKQGLEKFYEKELRGQKGVEIMLRDAHGRIQGKYLGGKLDKRPVAGRNLKLSIDIELQKFGEKLMGHKIGAIVAIEPETGEILCLVSAPTFNPAIMVGRDRGKNHMMLERDPRKPLFNRALMASYPPGSTFKTAQALTFLQEGIIHPYTTFPCYHGFVVPGLRVGCHAHPSPLPLVPSLATSCNSYFCWGLYRMIDNKKYLNSDSALTVWKDHMVSMGLGYKLGVDLPGEKRGLIPNAKFYDKIYGEHRWGGLRIIHTAIGQGEVLLTPLQIANLGASIANKGHFITPHIVKQIMGGKLDSTYRFPRYTTIDPKYYQYIIQGMRGAVEHGTCTRANYLPELEVCGKTGTAQNRGKDHSVFMGFAPMKKAKISICVYVENGGWGATYAVPIGALMMEHYLKGKIAPEREKLVESISNAVISYGAQTR